MRVVTRRRKLAAMRHFGMVLAAGASTRMRCPKALLPVSPGGRPLARVQADLLRAGGCRRVVVVLGARFDRIRTRLAGCEVVHNPQWARGRFTSVRAGLLALGDFEGCFILPVDTVGLSASTLRSICRFAERRRPAAVRPTYRGQDGKLLWISAALADEFRRLPATDRRLDRLVRNRVVRLPVNDPALLSNINTPAQWRALRKRKPAIASRGSRPSTKNARRNATLNRQARTS